MKSILLTVCVLGLALQARAQPIAGFKGVQYMRPATGDQKATTVKGNLVVDSNGIVFSGGKNTTLTIQKSAIKSLLYERSAKPRYGAGLLLAWPLLFTKSKAHWLTVQHEGGYAMFRLDKGNYRQVLAVIEAATGLKLDRQEER